MVMSIEREIYQFPVTIKMKRPEVLDKTDITGTLTVARNPAEEAYIRFQFQDLVGTGSITVTGTSNGSPTSEVVTVGTQSVITANMYTALTSIAATGFTSGNVWGSAVNKSREEIVQNVTLTSSTSPYAFMIIQLRDIRDVDMIMLYNWGHDIFTSHVGFCFHGLAIQLRKNDIITDQWGRDFLAMYPNNQDTYASYEEPIWEVALKQRGMEAYKT